MSKKRDRAREVADLARKEVEASVAEAADAGVTYTPEELRDIAYQAAIRASKKCSKSSVLS